MNMELDSSSGSGPFNSTELTINDSEQSNNELFIFTESIALNAKFQEHVNCGIIFSASEIYAGGKKEFHGVLGLIKKAHLDLTMLEPLSIIEAAHFNAVFVKSLKLQKNINQAKPAICCCRPVKPNFITTQILLPEFPHEKKLILHVMRLQNIQKSSRVEKHFLASKPDEATYSSTYEILSDFRQPVTSLSPNSGDETSLTINFHWHGSGYHYGQTPPHSAKAILKLQVAIGEPQSPAHELFLEITCLDTVINSVKDQSGTIFTNSISDEMYEKLAVFKENVSDISFYGNVEKQVKGSSGDDNGDLEKPMAQLIKKSFQRNDYDFTDKLWMLLREIEGTEEMRSYLDDILNDIVHGSLQPAISPTNETKLAKYIRQLYLEENEDTKLQVKEKILEFLSNDHAFMHLVNDIGFEKLRKDYYNFFMSKDLTLLSNLQHLRQQSSSSSCISFLWKLHYCLEIVITPAIYLQLDHDCQRNLLKAAMDYYSVRDIGSSSPVFSLSLLPVHDSSSALHETCESRQAKTWKQGMIKISNTGLKESNILHIESKNVCEEDMIDTVTIQKEQNDTVMIRKQQKVLFEEVVYVPV